MSQGFPLMIDGYPLGNAIVHLESVEDSVC